MFLCFDSDNITQVYSLIGTMNHTDSLVLIYKVYIYDNCTFKNEDICSPFGGTVGVGRLKLCRLEDRGSGVGVWDVLNEKRYP